MLSSKTIEFLNQKASPHEAEAPSSLLFSVGFTARESSETCNAGKQAQTERHASRARKHLYEFVNMGSEQEKEMQIQQLTKKKMQAYRIDWFDDHSWLTVLLAATHQKF